MKSQKIFEYIRGLEKENERLKEENKNLKSDYCKDKRIKDLEDELKNCKEQLKSSFSLSKSEKEFIDKMMKTHGSRDSREHYINRYEFYGENGAGGIAYCSCGKMCIFREIDD